MDIFDRYKGFWEGVAGFGKNSYYAARAAGFSSAEIAKSVAGKNVGSIAQGLIAQGIRDEAFQAETTRQLQAAQAQMEKQLAQQAAQFAAAQKEAKRREEGLQQRLLETQTQQGAGNQTANVLGAGQAKVVRPGSGTRFSRKELQIKSVNI